MSAPGSALGGPSGARRATHRRGTQIRAARTARRPGVMRCRCRRCRCPARGAAAMAPRRHDAIGCATNDPGTTPAIMAATRKVAKTGTAAASYSPDGGCRTRPPSYRPRMASPQARAGLSQRFIERAMRLAAVPLASRAADSRGLNQAQPSGGQRCRQPGQRNSKANAADDDQPSRHDRGQAPCDPTNSNHRLTPLARPSPRQDLTRLCPPRPRESRGACDTQPGPPLACADRGATEAAAPPRSNPGRDDRRS